MGDSKIVALTASLEMHLASCAEVTAHWNFWSCNIMHTIEVQKHLLHLVILNIRYSLDTLCKSKQSV